MVQMRAVEKNVKQTDGVGILAPTGSEEWIARLRSGDEAAVEELFASYQPKAYSLCLGILKSETGAREAAQDSLAEAARKISQFDGRSSFSTWLYRVVANHALMRLRSASRRREVVFSPDEKDSGTWNGVLDKLACERVPAPDQEIISHDSLQAIEKLCDRLPEKYCPIVALCDFQELPLAQAAAELGFPLRAAKSRLHRGRVELRALICGLGELCGPWCGGANGPPHPLAGHI